MALSNLNSISPTFSNNTKVLALESTLQQCVLNFRELLTDYEKLHEENENNKTLYLSLKSKCESKTCPGSEGLKKMNASNSEKIQAIASSLTKLNDTKDWNILTEIFQILFEDSSSAVKPTSITPKLEKIEVSPYKEDKVHVSPKKENVSITEDVSFNEESLCEIEGTPGRTSPIIQTKKTKSFAAKSSDTRDKKKCPNNWPSPEPKSLKLQYLIPRSKTGKLRQSRLNVVKLKQTSVVDLTCSPEYSGGRNGGEQVLPLVKKESVENDDTILPSPTGGPTSFSQLKTTAKDSQSKFKRPLSLKLKMDRCENSCKNDENRNHSNIEKEIAAMEDSINILNPRLVNRFNGIKEEKQIDFENNKLIKLESDKMQTDQDATHCDINSSISLLDHVNKLVGEHTSPKRPLEENINIMNTPPKEQPLQSSLSLLQPENKMAVDKVKRKLPELVEPIYKEPTVRNKQEKRNLQGWSCEQCKNFYGVLYKDNPVMLAKQIEECSKHRGRHNPERPKTPPNFWNPRWHVPEDTEELNRMNNAN